MAQQELTIRNIDPKILDRYIENVNNYNYYFRKRNESDKNRLKAVEYHKRMMGIQEYLGWVVLMALEKQQKRSIPVEL